MNNFRESKDGSHEYTVRNRNDDKEYIYLFNEINNLGFYSFFYKKRYKHIIRDGYRYWIMTSDINESIIINRCKEKYPSEFDSLAASYDKIYPAEDFIKEEEYFAAKYLSGLDNKIVLELCCGIGNLYRFLQNTHYKGCDISHEMLLEFRKKYKTALLYHCNIKNLSVDQKVDFAFISFGRASLLDDIEIRTLVSLIKPSGRAILSYYKCGYTPLTVKNIAKSHKLGQLIEENHKYEIYLYIKNV